jgi:flagellar basal-body rod protein FlgB
MYAGLFKSTAIPVLEQVVDFAQTRHTVLAGNIANVDTPGYKARDLSVEDFQNRLRQAIDSQHNPSIVSPGQPDEPRPPDMATIAKNTKTIMLHDESQVGMEYQVSEMAKNQLQHNMALQIMVQQFRQLQTAISGRL